MGNLGFPEMMIILVIALVVFGPSKLPEIGKSLGKGISEFKKASSSLASTWEEAAAEKKQDSLPESKSGQLTATACQAEEGTASLEVPGDGKNAAGR